MKFSVTFTAETYDLELVPAHSPGLYLVRFQPWSTSEFFGGTLAAPPPEGFTSLSTFQDGSSPTVTYPAGPQEASEHSFQLGELSRLVISGAFDSAYEVQVTVTRIGEV